MRSIALFLELIFVSALLTFVFGCKEEVKKEDSDSDSDRRSGEEGATEEQSDDGNGDSIDSSIKTFYAGFDGTNDYSLLLSGNRSYSIKDSSIATLTEETVTLSEETIDELLSDVEQNNPDFDAERFRNLLGREQIAYRLTPMKAGTTTLYEARRPRNGRGGGGGSAFDPAAEQDGDPVNLVINDYTTDVYDAGKSRYTTDGAGLLKACRSCHETGDENAPPHELGNIKEISDAEGVEWITTGKVRSRVARITHTWEFNNDAERDGIVAYLRGKVSKDVETFTKLIFEERLSDFN